MIHLYADHLGGYYIADRYDRVFLETCSACGDSDWYEGEYETMEEVALTMYKDNSSDEHIAEVTGLKVNVSFEKAED